jgi:hypothetical protein
MKWGGIEGIFGSDRVQELRSRWDTSVFRETPCEEKGGTMRWSQFSIEQSVARPGACRNARARCPEERGFALHLTAVKSRSASTAPNPRM